MLKYHNLKTLTTQISFSHGLNNPNEWYALKRLKETIFVIDLLLFFIFSETDLSTPDNKIYHGDNCI